MAQDIHEFLDSFRNVKRIKQNEYKCSCPVHADKTPSLSIKDDISKSGRILLHCHAGCRTEDILSAVGKTWADISPDNEEKASRKWAIRFVNGVKYELVAEYPYTDEDNRYLYSKFRYQNKKTGDKSFVVGRVVNGQFEYGRGLHEPTLYNLSELSNAIKRGKRIFYVEGEKDVETLRKYGLAAVSAGSVSDWKSEFAEYFKGASQVVVIADRDDCGQNLAKQISADLRSVVFEHKVITPSGLHKGDVSDFLGEEEQTIESLFKIIDDAEPIYAYWVIASKSKTVINPDLLASEYMKRNSLFLARNPGTKSDLIFLYKRGSYVKLSDVELSGEIRRWIPIGKARPDVISQVTKMILYSACVRGYDELDSDERYINLRNGLLDIHTGELISHDSELISTLQLDCNFDVKAKSPMWEEFIDMLCYDPIEEEIDIEMVRVLQEWTGFILSPIYGYRIKKSLLLFSALGNSGKSVYLSVLGGIMGSDSIANVDFDSLGNSRWATGRAFGKRLLAIGDEGGEDIDSSKNFKQMTGGDIVSAEFKGLQPFDYKFRGVICAACNLLPFFKDDKGDHVAERMMMLNCRRTIPKSERDPLFADKLLKERDGVFIWALEGLQRFLENGMHFSDCKSADALMDEYRAKHDTMYAFLQDAGFVEFTGNKRDTIRKTEFENMYLMYCEQNDVAGLKKKNIKSRLASLGIITKSHNNIEVYIGVRKC